MPLRDNAAPRPDPPDPEPRSANPVSGPSFLGLADEPAEGVSYLLEDEPAPSHRGAYLVVVLAVAAAAAGWHWRQDLRAWVARASAGTPAVQSPAANNQSAATAATQATETATPSGGATPTPPEGSSAAPPSAGSANTTPATASPAPPTAQSPGDQPAPNGVIASTAAAPVPSTTPADAQPPQSAPPAAATDAGANSQPADSDSATAKESEDQTAAAAAPAPVKTAPVVKSKSSPAIDTQKGPAGSATDALEAQGEKYLYGTGVAANCTLAQKNLLAAAQRSSARAQSVLATMYATGHCATRDLPLAYRWFARALHQDPDNIRIQEDLKVLWNQMTPDERQLAMHFDR